ncbi:MAG: septum formation initiator family protein [bacterium]|nr:septum formation initiator family protein [bacterium]
MDLGKFLKSKLASLVLGLILVLVMIGAVQIIIQKYEVDREIQRLQTEAEKINQKNLELTELVRYLNTPEYKERQVREQLNLKKEGEFVVALPNSTDEENSSQILQTEVSNTRKWFNYIFNIAKS